jgi:hypothetical protein
MELECWTGQTAQGLLGVPAGLCPVLEMEKPPQQAGPPSLRMNKGLMSPTCDSRKACQIGSDTDALVWVGEQTSHLMKSHPEKDRQYPDQGSPCGNLYESRCTALSRAGISRPLAYAVVGQPNPVQRDQHTLSTRGGFGRSRSSANSEPVTRIEKTNWIAF